MRYKTVYRAQAHTGTGMQKRIVVENQIGDVVYYGQDTEFTRVREARIVGIYPNFVRIDMGDHKTSINLHEFMYLKGAKCHWEDEIDD